MLATDSEEGESIEKIEINLVVNGEVAAAVPLEGPSLNKLLGEGSETLFWNTAWGWRVRESPYSIQVRIARLGTREEVAELMKRREEEEAQRRQEVAGVEAGGNENKGKRPPERE